MTGQETVNQDLERMFQISNESLEYQGKYQISNWDFEYAKEHYEKDIILMFDKKDDGEYAIDKALDKIRKKLGEKANSIDWSQPFNIQDVVNLYREHSNDEGEKFSTVFETSGVFSIERLGYEELYDRLMKRVPSNLQYKAAKEIKKAVEHKLALWKKRNESIEV